jgi:hypothetical protein
MGQFDTKAAGLNQTGGFAFLGSAFVKRRDRL